MNDPTPTVIGIELLVRDLEPALLALTDGFGCELAWRGPSPDVDAEVAVLDAGAITITLIAPTSTGRPTIPDQQPRLSQLVFGLDAAELPDRIAALRELGIAVADDGLRPYVPPKVAEGVLGERTALVLTTLEQPS